MFPTARSTIRPYLAMLLWALIAASSSRVLALEPSGLAFGGGWTLLPSVQYGVVEDSNAYLQSESNKENVTITRIRPQLLLQLDTPKALMEFSYELEQGAYSNNANDNYTDQFFNLTGVRSFGRRLEGSVDASYVLGHDARGAGVDEGITAIEDVFYPDKYRTLTVGGSLDFGADASFLGSRFYSSVMDKNYLNNYDRGTANREYQEVTAGNLFSFYVSPITDIVLEARWARIDYESPEEVAQLKEGWKQTYLAGASWDLTGKTTGSMKLGLTTRSFDDRLVPDNSSFSWEGSIVWTPKAHSEFSLDTSRGFNETSGAGVYVLTSELSSSWNHRFSVFIATEMSFGFRMDEIYSNNVVERTDDIFSSDFSFIYSPSRSMDMDVGVSFDRRVSEEERLDYDRMVFSLGLTLGV